MTHEDGEAREYGESSSTTYDDWIDKRREALEKRRESLTDEGDEEDAFLLRNFLGDKETANRTLPAIEKLRRDVLARCAAERWSNRELYDHLSRLNWHLNRFDEILRQQYLDVGFLKNTDTYLWRHVDIAWLYQSTSTYQRDNFKDKSADLRGFVATYLAQPELHYPYFDWLLLDALTACNVVEGMERQLIRKHGEFAYALFENNPWKLLLFKVVGYPLLWAFNWGTPALIAWGVAHYYSLTAALIVGALLYGWNIVSLIWRIVSKIKMKLMLSGKASHEELVVEELVAYATLKGPVLHAPTIRAAFERATAKGVLANQEAMCILDRLVANPAVPVWDNQ
jgi:hypothetical protein